MSSQYGELRPTSGWDLLASLRYPCKFQRVSRLGSVTAPHSSSGRQPKLAALNRGRHLYSAGSRHVGHWPTSLVMATGCGVWDRGQLCRGYLLHNFSPNVIKNRTHKHQRSASRYFWRMRGDILLYEALKKTTSLPVPQWMTVYKSPFTRYNRLLNRL